MTREVPTRDARSLSFRSSFAWRPGPAAATLVAPPKRQTSVKVRPNRNRNGNRLTVTTFLKVRDMAGNAEARIGPELMS